MFSFLFLAGVQLLPSVPKRGLWDRLVAQDTWTPLTGQALEEARAVDRASELAWQKVIKARAYGKRVERRCFLALAGSSILSGLLLAKAALKIEKKYFA